jgi:hypothetical protein
MQHHLLLSLRPRLPTACRGRALGPRPRNFAHALRSNADVPATPNYSFRGMSGVNGWTPACPACPVYCAFDLRLAGNVGANLWPRPSTAPLCRASCALCSVPSAAPAGGAFGRAGHACCVCVRARVTCVLVQGRLWNVRDGRALGAAPFSCPAVRTSSRSASGLAVLSHD